MTFVDYPDNIPNSKSERDQCTHCTYCGNLIALVSHDHDHFPVPKTAGGTRVVPACRDCHSLKDRITMNHWHPSLAFAATEEFVLLDLVPTLHSGVTQVPDVWEYMSRASRLLWAKTIRYIWEGDRLDREGTLDFLAEINEARNEYVMEKS